jgi:hypothetical protein
MHLQTRTAPSKKGPRKLKDVLAWSTLVAVLGWTVLLCRNGNWRHCPRSDSTLYFPLAFLALRFLVLVRGTILGAMLDDYADDHRCSRNRLLGTTVLYAISTLRRSPSRNWLAFSICRALGRLGTGGSSVLETLKLILVRYCRRATYGCRWEILTLKVSL